MLGSVLSIVLSFTQILCGTFLPWNVTRMTTSAATGFVYTFFACVGAALTVLLSVSVCHALYIIAHRLYDQLLISVHEVAACNAEAFEMLRLGDHYQFMPEEAFARPDQDLIDGRPRGNTRGANHFRFMMRAEHPWIDQVISEHRRPTPSEIAIWHHEFRRLAKAVGVRDRDFVPLCTRTFACQFVPTQADIDGARLARSFENNHRRREYQLAAEGATLWSLLRLALSRVYKRGLTGSMLDLLAHVGAGADPMVGAEVAGA